MGDLAPATPTSTLICLEDGDDLFLDDDDDSPSGDGAADLRLAADDDRHLLLPDRDDDEYVALMLDKEVGLGSAGGGAMVEEMDEWTKAARASCVAWIIKVLRAFRATKIRCRNWIFPFLSKNDDGFSAMLADEREVPIQREDGVRRGDVPRSVPRAAACQCNQSPTPCAAIAFLCSLFLCSVILFRRRVFVRCNAY